MKLPAPKVQALALTVLASCAHLATETARDGRAVLPRAEPASVGLDPDRLAEIPERMAGFVDRGEIAGAVTLVARRGRIVHLEAVGTADIAAGRPMREDTLFAIASMTKPITATAVMVLRDEEKLALDDPVLKYIPEFGEVALQDGEPPARPVTIRDLLTHTSGLAGSQQNRGSLEETARALAKRPLRFHPGTRWQYSPGLSVCGRVVGVVSGKPFGAFLRERIFEPLGMEDTTFVPPAEDRERLAALYKPGAEKKSLVETSHWLRQLSEKRTPNPSGGLFSTASDMARFYQMVLEGGELGGRRIVSRESVEEMVRVHTGDLRTGFTPGNGWGLGWCIVREPQGVSAMLSPGSFGHGGAFGTQGWIDPEREMIFVLMIQRTGFGNSDASEIRRVFQELAVEAVEAVEGESTRPGNARASPKTETLRRASAPRHRFAYHPR